MLKVRKNITIHLIGKKNIQIKDPVLPKQLRLMFVGDDGVGKTSIINSFINGNENIIPKIEATNDVDIFFKKMKIKDESVLVNVKII